MKTMIYFLELSELENFEEYEKYKGLLSLAKQDKISRFKFNIDKKLCLLADLLVRYLACKSLYLNNSDLLFDQNIWGKPYLTGFPYFQYNISHTRNAILIGVSNKQIGVDVEKIKSADLKIAERFFCEKELLYISSLKEEKEIRFYEVWTKKEAYIKCLGKGLSLPLTSFDVTDIELSKILNVTKINNYMISTCSDANFNTKDIIKLDEYQVSKILMDFAQSNFD